MKPDLEVVQIGQGQSFKAWEHGYPYHTVRWHFHPEMEVHYVVATSGRYYIGDFIGEFGPGNLVLTGPNLPHNWISDVPEGTIVPLRNRVALGLYRSFGFVPVRCYRNGLFDTFPLQRELLLEYVGQRQ